MNASIDIGTNTVLLLIAVHEGQKVKVIHEEQRIPRLGQGVDQAKNLSEKGMEGVINAINDYRRIIKDRFPEVSEVKIVATSAVRDAGNRNMFLKLLKEETGFEANVLSGAEEAEYTFWGAQSVLKTVSQDSVTVVLDIGGGSTEIAVGEKGELTDAYSYDMGCVRFTERFLSDSVVTEENISMCRKGTRDMLKAHSFDLSSGVNLVGVSGTVTSLAYMDQELEEYKNERIDDYTLSTKKITQFIEWVSQISSEELLNRYPVVMKGRADIFLAGLLILEGFMNRYDFDGLTVSTGGIRHGAILLQN